MYVPPHHHLLNQGCVCILERTVTYEFKGQCKCTRYVAHHKYGLQGGVALLSNIGVEMH